MSGADVFAFCALIVGLICGAGMWLSAYQTRLKNRERELELQVKLAESRERMDQSEVGQLEQRLRVLERIATDRKTELADQIEALREGKEIVQ